MKEVKIKLYKFDELPSAIQDKVIDKLHNINVDYD